MVTRIYLDENRVSAPLSFEYLMSQLFGSQTFHGFCNLQHSEKSWKGHLNRILRTIRKAIEANTTVADQYYRRRLAGMCEQGMEDIGDAPGTQRANLAMIECLVRLVFMLLGRMPSNFFRKHVTIRQDWRLSTYRTLVYTQTEAQKLRLIISLAEEGPYTDRFKDRNELFYKYVDDFRRDGRAFLRWFNKEYPDIYTELF
jgi:hypothetical protein